MRILIPMAALALASCGDNEVANNAAVSEESEAAEIGPVNDITAIDAATGEAANMAADVSYTFNEAEMNQAEGNSAANATAENSQ